MQWIRLADKRPDNGIRVLVYAHCIRGDDGGVYISSMDQDDMGWYFCSDGDSVIIEDRYTTVTHWMPLPTAPGVPPLGDMLCLIGNIPCS